MQLYILFFALVILAVGGMLFGIRRKRKRIFNMPVFSCKNPDMERSELIKYAEKLSHEHSAYIGREGGIKHLRARLSDAYYYITYVYKTLCRNSDARILGAEEWLLDNFYIIEEQVKQIRLFFDKNNLSRLLVISGGDFSGCPRIFAVSRELAANYSGIVDENLIVDFFSAYQKGNYLSDTEILSLCHMLSVAVIEETAVLCSDIINAYRRRQDAGNFYNTLINSKNPEEFISANADEIIKDGTFFEHLTAKLKSSEESSNILRCLEKVLEEKGTSVKQLAGREHTRMAACKMQMGCQISRLRFIPSIDFNKLFSSLSIVENTLAADPLDVYSKMDDKSKNYYRKRVAKIAAKYKMTQIDTAKKILSLAKKDGCHIGEYIINKPMGRPEKSYNEAAGYFYILFVSLSFIVLTFTGYLASRSFPVPLCITFTVLFSFMGLEISISFFNFLATRTLSPRIIPKIEIKGDISREYASMAVISTLLINERECETLIEKIESYYLANRSENLFFGLLCDLPDSKMYSSERDSKLVKIVSDGIDGLNRKYASDDSDIFFMFSRDRVYNPRNRRYMAFERKRGAIMELCRLLTSSASGFTCITGRADKLPPVKYVITLDADTRLGLSSAKELIGAMIHPLNRPVIDESLGRVVKGYGIMQPRIDIDLIGANRSVFSKIFAGQGGIDIYSCAISDVYQDLFGEGIFTGKGIFDVYVFSRVMKNKIPNDRILSHDLLEGCFARCGLLSDVSLSDGFPFNYISYCMRQHRWIRGDWQLIPYIFGRGRLPALSRWKMIDNLRRSLTAPVIFTFILLAFFIFPSSALALTLFSVLCLCFNLIISSAEWSIKVGYRSGALRSHSAVIHGAWAFFLQGLILFAVLPHSAFVSISAVLQTVYRLVFSKRNLLLWTSASEADIKSGTNVFVFYWKMIINLIAGLGLILFAPKETILAGIIGAVWLAAPLYMSLISRRIEPGRREISKGQRQLLTGLSRSIWNFFSELVNEKENFLPPDNFQEEPFKGAAHRTSPTNIGLYLLCTVSAYDLKFIGFGEMLTRLENTVDSVMSLDKWNGHLYNWYNTSTKEVLRPRYVSTVDSGNFTAYLMTLRQALLQFHDGRSLALVKKVSSLIENTSFSELFDKSQELMSIGYNAEENMLTNSYYDLLASEARTASYIAAARGEVSKKHWFSLGRALVTRGGYRGLVSWTGTMFEYLMPLLIMKNVPNTLLCESCYFAVNRQRAYAQRRRIPWGLSESGYYSFDVNLNYQYRAFGVPDLGLKRGLSSDLVVSPYSSVLALMVNYDAAMSNIKNLVQEGYCGKYGLYEAIDYTPSRRVKNSAPSIVRSYMAHHNGMSLIAINNVLNNNIMQQRFHSDEYVKAAEELLCERIPLDVIIAKENKEKLFALPQADPTQDICSRIVHKLDPSNPNMHALSNGVYSTVVCDTGTGYSKCSDYYISRFRYDLFNPQYGNFVYVRNLNTGKVFSNTYAPIFDNSGEYKTVFSAESAEFYRSGSDGTEVSTKLYISSEENAELRRINIYNNSGSELDLELTSYTELSMARFSDDLAHPAFGNLFVWTEKPHDKEMLIAQRRPRSTAQKSFFCMHTVSSQDDCNIKFTDFDTGRDKFIGRLNNLSNPVGVSGELSKSLGAVTDPCFAAKVRVRLRPYETKNLCFITAFSYSEEELYDIYSKYRVYENTERAFDLAVTRNQIENRYLAISNKEAALAYALLPHIFYITPWRKLNLSRAIAKNSMLKEGLWRFGISGDKPIITLAVQENTSLEAVRQLITVHEFYKIKNIDVDLVMISDESGGYIQGVNDSINEILSSSKFGGGSGFSPDGVFVLPRSGLTDGEFNLILSVSRVVFYTSKDSLLAQLVYDGEQSQTVYYSPDKEKQLEMDSFSRQPASPKLLFFNGYGGFLPLDSPEFDRELFSSSRKRYVEEAELSGRQNKNSSEVLSPSRVSVQSGGFEEYSEETAADFDTNLRRNIVNEKGEYIINFTKRNPTPAPWINVISNDKFGCTVSESGSGYTFRSNSRENKLTPWNNDPVTDPSGEMIFIKDNYSGAVSSASAYPCFGSDYLVRHGFGYSVFEHSSMGLFSSLTVFVASEDPVKFNLLELENLTPRNRDLELSFYADTVMGDFAHNSKLFLNSGVSGNVLYFRNPSNADFSGQVMFAGSVEEIWDFTCDRREFFGASRSSIPDAVLRDKLSCESGFGMDCCAFFRVKVKLRPFEKRSVVFFLGEDEHPEEIIKKYDSNEKVIQEFERVKSFWKKSLCTVNVSTPSESLDCMLNGHLLYQTIACRIWARTAFYQCGGAYGFRDQLQDVMAAGHISPEIMKNQIIKACSHQFLEGDVQHWWHESGADNSSKGVRTKFSDDLLWLPYVVAYYLSFTSDTGILDIEAPYLEADELTPSQDEAYIIPKVSEVCGSVYEHCVKAIDRSLKFGEHGLPLMGSGDWNDGMSSVGSGGKGESVWLAWFMYDILLKFSQICLLKDDSARSSRYLKAAEDIKASTEENAWDGMWYRRAYFDNGSAIGSKSSEECKIDTIAQAWSVISGGADFNRSRTALASALEHLADYKLGIIKLLTPAFEKSDPSPGYIQSYVPGVRENGGQYTHAAVWLILAFSRAGMSEKALELFELINPVNHSRTKEQADIYRAEPYAVCADVYAAEGNEGRGGWSWYTGASGWMYRVVLEDILGFSREGEKLIIKPCIPDSWDEYRISYRYKSATYQILIERGSSDSGSTAEEKTVRMYEDGRSIGEILLEDDGKTHNILVVVD